MKYLSLFSGVGGGDLGLQSLVGLECVGYVERDEYCCRVLEQRIKDGFLADAPIFCGDIREWLKRGYADAYSGLVDVVAGGFPCQPFSVAGKGKAGGDDRNMWPETIESIRRVRPSIVFLENVPGLLSSGYAATVASDLHGYGYQVLPPFVLGAVDVGAPHKRDRVWIAAYSSIEGGGRLSVQQRGPQQADIDVEWMGEDVANASSSRFSGQNRIQSNCDQTEPGGEMGYASCKRLEFAQAKGRYGGQVKTTTGASWWAIEPGLGRVADGVANRVDRLRAIGNGQVSAVAKEAWQILIG